MHTRSKAVAAALLLTASLTGTTLATGSADAATGHGSTQRTTHATARPVPAVAVDITVTKKGISRSRTGFRPGNTIFHVRNVGGDGTVEVLRMRHGYTLKMLRKDFGGLFSGDLRAIRRIDRKVIFYAGTEIDKKQPMTFATYLDAGRYLIANLDKNTVTWMRVGGRPQARSLPGFTGRINLVEPNRFANPGTRTPAGWMRTTNKTDEPHFVDLQQVKWSTTKKKVRKYFASGAHGAPSWGLPASAGTLVLSPGHTVLWKYDLPRGKYLELCFWPDDETGMPHAMMGMWNLTKLKWVS